MYRISIVGYNSEVSGGLNNIRKPFMAGSLASLKLAVINIMLCEYCCFSLSKNIQYPFRGLCLARYFATR